ncbi:hypothetical protein [Candidatus Enterovibrio escicola]|nr:hypothetical protein [Candidatus Enterovibrio escacola]
MLWLLELVDAGAVADDCMDAGGRATQEQLPRTNMPTILSLA